jgi:hypothetical protein
MMQQIRRLAKENRALRQQLSEQATSAKPQPQYDGDVCHVLEVYSSKVEELQQQLQQSEQQERELKLALQSLKDQLRATEDQVGAWQREREASQQLSRQAKEANRTTEVLEVRLFSLLHLSRSSALSSAECDTSAGKAHRT